MELNEKGHLWSRQLGLFLGVEEGKLRFFTPDGELVLTLEKAAKAAEEKADRLAEKLRELGVDPETA